MRSLVSDATVRAVVTLVAVIVLAAMAILQGRPEAVGAIVLLAGGANSYLFRGKVKPEDHQQ